MSSKITDHVTQALGRLIEQFKTSDNFKEMITAFVDQIQDIEDAAYDVYTLRYIETAEGVQLDELGLIVGESRLGKTDEEYRAALLFRVFINMSNGEPERMITAFRTFTEADKIKFYELYPAAVHLISDGSTVPDNLISALENVAPAGVEVTAAITYGVDFPLSVARDDGGVPIIGLGFSELGSAVPGDLTQGQIAEGFS